MKYGNTFFMQLSRKICSEEYKDLSINAKWLYVTLNELEHRYCNGAEKSDDFFYRSNENLAVDCGMSLPTLKRAKSELSKTDLIHVFQMHWIDKNTGKKSSEKVTAYKILR